MMSQNFIENMLTNGDPVKMGLSLLLHSSGESPGTEKAGSWGT